MSRHLLVLSLLFSFGAWARTPSNTVPDSSLVANFSVGQLSLPSTQFEAAVDLEAITSVNGVERHYPLALSNNESISFTGGGKTIQYSTNTSNILPLVVGGTYSVTYKRFNGETFNGKVALPPSEVFTSPAANSVFQPSRAVHVTWSPVRCDAQIMIAMSNCGSVLDQSNWDPNNLGIEFPANAAANCSGTPQVTIYAVNANIGSGYGSFAGENVSSVNFSYKMKGQVELAPLSQFELTRYLRIARRTGQRLFRVVR